MDGSAIGHCMLLEEAGIHAQSAYKKAIAIKKPIEIVEGKKLVRNQLSANNNINLSFLLKHIKKRSHELELLDSCTK